MLHPPPQQNIPSYKLVQNDILATIQANKLRTGDLIPSEKVLAEQHKVSIGTVKKALGDLVAQGYLYRQQGRGTFVSGGFVRSESRRIYKALPFFDQDDQPQASQFISSAKGTGDSLFSRATGLPEGTPIFVLRRLLFSGGVRFACLVSHLRADKLPDFDRIDSAEFEKNSLYVILDRRYGLHNLHLRELLSVAEADAETAACLGLSPGAPLLRSDLVFTTYDDEPYEYRISHCRTDSLKLFREF